MKRGENFKRKTIKKNKKFNLKIFFSIILLIIFIAIIIFFLSGLFNISEIKVNNVVKTNADEIIQKSGIKKDKNIFLQKYYRAKKNIEEINRVKNVKISKKLPKTVVIDIEERMEMYQVEHSAKYMIIDEQGYILRETNKKQTLPVIEIDNAIIENKRRLRWGVS